jgi:hypothetical protein
MAKAPPPNYTQSPNVYFDKWLREINSLAELKVVNAIMRNTFGWHEKETTLSFNELQEMTGLSRGGLTKGIQLALEHGYIERTKGSQGKLCTYRVAVQTSLQNRLVTEADTSLQSELVSAVTGLQNRPELVHEIDCQPVYVVDRPIDKEKEKESRKKEGDCRGFPFDHFAVLEYSETIHPEPPLSISQAEVIANHVPDSVMARALWTKTLRTFKGNGYHARHAGNAVDRFLSDMAEIAAGKKDSPVPVERVKTIRERMAAQ